ncbi:hypothetical protein FNV43_RR20582 [Rhamnella rubrinervis]|uniref:Uncharacterized protein n=1 Tax=Rhamnella rubrinervis TaxID=2594499 RepID=A0A8K0DW73_9ROSA|nr:hypothetical protein FNV43_RR20582 [Rhamnella rubrinervis]
MGLENLSLLNLLLAPQSEELDLLTLVRCCFQIQRFLTIAQTCSGKKLRNTRDFAERLEPFIADTVLVMNEAISDKKTILVEGGQATMLDIDFGTYPLLLLLAHLLVGFALVLALHQELWET